MSLFTLVEYDDSKYIRDSSSIKNWQYNIIISLVK